ncbi:MAG: hypothetical protein JJU00_07495 [Opitutales bacterium]|nr:hypothetical protein [Opitutales bacterium]
MKKTIERHHREALRDLLLGYVEHCEIAPNLTGTLERTLYHHGVKYAVPAFSFRGPIPPDGPTRFIGLVAGRHGGDRLSAEVTLQLIERLVLQPGLGEGLWLRILPVLDPVGLERGNEAAPPAELGEIDEAVRLRCGHGVIEIATSNRAFPAIGLRADPEWKEAAYAAVESTDRLASEGDGSPDTRYRFQVNELPASARVPWNLYIAIPASWNPSAATHFASQWLLVFFRHLQSQANLHPQPDSKRETLTV